MRPVTTRTLKLTLLIGFGLAASLPATAFDGASGPYLAGRLASMESDYVAAADYYTRALASDPGNPVLLEATIVSQIDFLNLSSFFDAIVVRHHEDDFATRAAWALSRSHRPIPVISAGSGRSQHVTQSLLDVYTLRYSFAEQGGIDGKTVLIIGDIARNRAARSLAYLMTKFDQPRVYFVSPKDFVPEADLLAYLEKHSIEVRIHEGLESMLREHGRQLDAIYVTRLQQEWDAGGPPRELGSSEAFILKPEYRQLIRPNCVVMHPLPRVNELPDEWEEHPGFVVWRQVRNGMWIRAALFAVVHGADEEIRARARRLDLL